MKHWHRILVVASVAACALLAASPGLAKRPAPAAVDAQAALASVHSAVTGSGPIRSSSGTLVAKGAKAAKLAACYWVQVKRWGKNLLGWTLWTYYQRIEWCANATAITSVTRIRWGEVSFPGWAFKGHTSSTTSGGVGKTSYRARTQGHFCLVEYFSCVQNAYPWIDITVYRNGTYTWSTGG